MKFAAFAAAGVCVNVNIVVEPLPLNSSMCGDACARTADNNCLPKYVIKILAPFEGASAKLIFGSPVEREME